MSSISAKTTTHKVGSASKKVQTIELKGDAARGFMFAMYQEEIDKLKKENEKLNGALEKLAFKLNNMSCSGEFKCSDCDICPKDSFDMEGYSCMDALMDWALGNPMPWGDKD